MTKIIQSSRYNEVVADITKDIRRAEQQAPRIAASKDKK